MSKYKMITALMHDCRAQIEMAKCKRLKEVAND